MLKRHDFVSRLGSHLYTEDESLIDPLLEGIEIDGQPILDLFYLSELYDELKVDYGGGVMGITCRDVIDYSEENETILREQLGLRSTRQNNQICKEIIQLCIDEVKRGGYLF